MADNKIFVNLMDHAVDSAMERVYVNPMDTVREGAEDIHVRSYVAYGKAADHKLYKESTYTTQLNKSDVEYAFNRGMLLIVDGSNRLHPVAMNGNMVMTAAKTGAGAEEFDATDTYNVGDVVTKDGKIYKCTTQISVAAAWDASKWTEITSVDWVEWAAKVTASV